MPVRQRNHYGAGDSITVPHTSLPVVGAAALQRCN
jgi:hypothetical protein